MKKNGYTLVELILTIALLSAASTIVLINTVGMKSTQDQDKQKRFESSIESAACAYVDTMGQIKKRNNIKNNCQVASDSSKPICQITLAELVDKDLALVDPELKDPKTNKTALNEQDNIYVFVYFEKSGSTYEKKCEFKRR